MIASDFMTYYRPSLCEMRGFLRQQGEKEAEPSAFEQVLSRLGVQHEKEHLATLGTYVDLSGVTLGERVLRTLEAITNRVTVIYQPAFQVNTTISGTDVEIVGMFDFLIFDGNGYLIRDSKMSRHIDDDSHPEILCKSVYTAGYLKTHMEPARKAFRFTVARTKSSIFHMMAAYLH